MPTDGLRSVLNADQSNFLLFLSHNFIFTASMLTVYWL